MMGDPQSLRNRKTESLHCFQLWSNNIAGGKRQRSIDRHGWSGGGQGQKKKAEKVFSLSVTSIVEEFWMWVNYAWPQQSSYTNRFQLFSDSMGWKQWHFFSGLVKTNTAVVNMWLRWTLKPTNQWELWSSVCRIGKQASHRSWKTHKSLIFQCDAS